MDPTSSGLRQSECGWRNFHLNWNFRRRDHNSGLVEQGLCSSQSENFFFLVGALEIKVKAAELGASFAMEVDHLNIILDRDLETFLREISGTVEAPTSIANVVSSIHQLLLL